MRERSPPQPRKYNIETKIVKTKYIFYLTSLLLVGNPTFLQAATVLVDFGDINSASETQSGWNHFTNVDPSKLLNFSTGGSSGITLVRSLNGEGNLREISANNETLGENEPANPPFPASGYHKNSIKGFLFDPNPTEFRLTGLDNSLTYTLFFYGYVNRTDERETRILINGGEGDETYEAAHTDSPNYGNGGIALFYDVTPEDGEIVIEVSRGPKGGNWILNTLEIQFTPVPEPSSAFLMAGLAFVACARRRRH